MQNPNILFIMVDQLSAKALSMYGHPMVQTPNLDRLGARGTVFDAAYCNSPLCGPSRQSMMSGRLPSRCGGYDNATGLAVGTPTFAHYLSAAGYRTCLSGKMHFVGADQKQGFQERLTTDIYPADFSWTPNWANPDAKVRFQDMQNVLNAGPCERSMQIDYDDDVAYQAGRWLYDRARDSGDQPWMLTVSFTSPHDPYMAQPEFWDLYEDGDLPTVRHVKDDAHTVRLKAHYSIQDVDNATLRRMRHGYYASISYVDAKVGALLDQLERTGLADNTVIVFTSDHGDMMGERGLYYKKNFFEWAARVPMIMAGPGVEVGRCTAPVSLVDILPTFCELAGITPLVACGQSLLSSQENPVFGEYLAEGVFEPTFMIRDGEFKLLWAEHDPPLLFDMASDPDELTNLASDPVHTSVLHQLLALAQSTWNPSELRADIIASQNQRRLVHQAGDPRWDHAPDLSMSDRYVRAGKWTVEVEAAAHLDVK